MFIYLIIINISYNVGLLHIQQFQISNIQRNKLI